MRAERAEPSDEQPTTAQLRADIDSGRTGDKIGGLDLAAAPLGTDDEAAGVPPSPQAIRQARLAERRTNSARANAAQPELQPDAEMKRGAHLWLGALAGVAAAAVLALFLVLAH